MTFRPHLVLPLIFIFTLSACSRVDEEQLAFEACKRVMLGFAKNPSASLVARVPADTSDGASFLFRWQRGSGLAFQNGYGALIEQTGHCYISRRRLSNATFDGKSVTGSDLLSASSRAASLYADFEAGRWKPE